MSDKIFPVTEPSAAPISGTATANPASKTAKFRHTQRPQPYNHGHGGASCDAFICYEYWDTCRCCVSAAALVTLFLLLVGGIVFMLSKLFRPSPPVFSIPSLSIYLLNLTAGSPSTASHLSAFFNLTLTSKNPNSRFSFLYDQFSLTALTSVDNVVLGNGTLPGFVSRENDETSFENVVVSGSADMDADTVNKLTSDESRGNDGSHGVGLKLVLDTKVAIKARELTTKKVEITVTCDGITGMVLINGSFGPLLADTTGTRCNVDLRIPEVNIKRRKILRKQW